MSAFAHQRYLYCSASNFSATWFSNWPSIPSIAKWWSIHWSIPHMLFTITEQNNTYFFAVLGCVCIVQYYVNPSFWANRLCEHSWYNSPDFLHSSRDPRPCRPVWASPRTAYGSWREAGWSRARRLRPNRSHSWSPCYPVCPYRTMQPFKISLFSVRQIIAHFAQKVFSQQSKTWWYQRILNFEHDKDQTFVVLLSLLRIFLNCRYI